MLGREAAHCLLTEPCYQEEIRIDATTVFVDPYEEADAQVRQVQLAMGKAAASCSSCWAGRTRDWPQPCSSPDCSGAEDEA